MIVAAAATVLGLLAIAYVVGYLMTGDRLPKDARISGVAVGGLDRAAAVAELTRQVGPRVSGPIEVTAGGERAELDPASAGLAVDYDASIEKAGGGRSLDPRHIFTVLTGGRDTDATVVSDPAKLSAALVALAGTTDQQPRDAGIRYRGTRVVLDKARSGVTLDQDAAAAVVRDRVLDGVRPLELPAAVVEPAITDADARQVIRDFARPAVAAGVKVSAGSAGSFTLSPHHDRRGARLPGR